MMGSSHGHEMGHDHLDHAGHGMGQGDMPDFHGMLLFGERHVYLSHLPMIAHPHHDFQVLMEVRLLDGQGKPGPERKYFADRRKSGARLYSLAPNENFVLTELIEDGERKARSSFPGAVWRGHFERTGRRLLTKTVEVKVEKTFHFRQFDPDEAALLDLTYILFGSGEERYLAHRITRAPDFDQLLRLEPIGPFDTDLPEAHLDGGDTLVVLRGRENTLAGRLRAGETVAGEAVFLGHPHKLQLAIKDEIYLEESELRARPDFGQSSMEKEAGF